MYYVWVRCPTIMYTKPKILAECSQTYLSQVAWGWDY